MIIYNGVFWLSPIQETILLLGYIVCFECLTITMEMVGLYILMRNNKILMENFKTWWIIVLNLFSAVLLLPLWYHLGVP